MRTYSRKGITLQHNIRNFFLKIKTFNDKSVTYDRLFLCLIKKKKKINSGEAYFWFNKKHFRQYLALISLLESAIINLTKINIIIQNELKFEILYMD